MRLVNEQFGFIFDWDQTCINSLICENQQTFYKLVKDFMCLNEKTNFVLSYNDKIIDLADSIDVIMSPFNCDLNKKKLLDKLLLKLRKDIFDTELYNDFLLVNKKIKEFFDNISLNCDFDIDNNIEIDPKGLLKYMDIKLVNYSEDPIENVLVYLDYCKKLLETKLFIFINLKEYFLEKDIFKLYKSIEYNKYNVLFIDNKEYERYPNEYIYIIDKDNCGID